ncbi:hypothetical protein AOLI_G00150840 [Acnodon oligacanthus]
MSPFIHSLGIGSEMPDLDFATKHRQQPAQRISSPGDYRLSLSQLTPTYATSAAEQQEDDGHMVSKRSPITRLFLAVGTLLSSRSAGQNEGEKRPLHRKTHSFLKQGRFFTSM